MWNSLLYLVLIIVTNVNTKSISLKSSHTITVYIITLNVNMYNNEFYTIGKNRSNYKTVKKIVKWKYVEKRTGEDWVY